MSSPRRSTPGSRTELHEVGDKVCPQRGEGLRSSQGARERRKTASWQPVASRIRLPLKESDISVVVNPEPASGPSNDCQCGFWDSHYSAAQVKSVEQPCVCARGPRSAWAAAITMALSANTDGAERQISSRNGGARREPINTCALEPMKCCSF
jgi:hypothetical protein